jgi:uncharacterized protein with GYD domain
MQTALATLRRTSSTHVEVRNKAVFRMKRMAAAMKVLSWYWTLGRYDTVLLFEAANEKEGLKTSIDVAEFVATETLVAIPREEAIKLV